MAKSALAKKEIPFVRIIRPRKHYKSCLIAAGFSILLLMPTLDQWLGFSKKFVSTEKRTLTPVPTFYYPHVRTFIADFTQYYKENFGWRNALFYYYSWWKYNVLRTSPLPEKVVVGKKGWFYPGNSMNHVLDRHQGAEIHPDTMNAIAHRLRQYQQQLTTQGIKLYLLVVPDSYTIYPEYLPEYLRNIDSQKNFDRIKSYVLQHTRIPFVDVRKQLLTAKSGHQVYFQTDTHWNFYGSLLGTLTLVERIRTDFPQIPVPILANYQVKAEKGHGGDLVMMLALNEVITDSVQYTVIVPPYLMSKPADIERPLNPKVSAERFLGPSANSPKLLLVGDSFSYWMNRFLPGYFSNTYITRDHKLDMKLVQQEKPDVVIIEIAERNFDWL